MRCAWCEKVVWTVVGRAVGRDMALLYTCSIPVQSVGWTVCSDRLLLRALAREKVLQKVEHLVDQKMKVEWKVVKSVLPRIARQVARIVACWVMNAVAEWAVDTVG